MFYFKKILLGVLLICPFLSHTLKSQSLIDSLDLKLNSDIKVEEKLDAIKNVSGSLILNQPDTLIYYCNYALKMCKTYKIDNKKASFLAILGEVHFNLSNYSEAINYSFEAIKIAEKFKDSVELGTLYNSVGTIYRVSGKLDEAKTYFFKSLNVREHIKDSSGIAASFNNIGNAYMMEAKYDTGMTYWGNSLKIKLAIGDSIGATTTMNNMAMYYRDIGETQKALDYFNLVLRIKMSINDYNSISMVYQNMGELYYKKNEIDKAIDYYNKALNYAELSKTKQLISFIHQELAIVYYSIEKYKLAYDHFVIHSNLDDTIFSEETVNNLNEIESKYENEKKVLIIKNLEKDKIAQKEKESLIIITGAIGFLAMFIIVFIISKNYQQKKKDHQLISEQKNILFKKNEEITDSITYARRLQEAILPPEHLIKEKLPNSFVLFKPKDVVSGDFYWMEEINNHIIIAAADCTGHGVPGAMVSVVCSNALNRAVKEFNITSPGEILNKVRVLVIETFEKSTENVKDGMDISICSINTKTYQIEYAGANNPLWILRANSSEIEEIKANKQPVGVHLNPVPFNTHIIQLAKGDSIYLFSDGYPDQFGGERGKKMKYKPFKDLLIESAKLEANQQKEFLAKKFKDWKGTLDQIDDVCIIGIKI